MRCVASHPVQPEVGGGRVWPGVPVPFPKRSEGVRFGLTKIPPPARAARYLNESRGIAPALSGRDGYRATQGEGGERYRSNKKLALPIAGGDGNHSGVRGRRNQRIVKV